MVYQIVTGICLALIVGLLYAAWRTGKQYSAE